MMHSKITASVSTDKLKIFLNSTLFNRWHGKLMQNNCQILAMHLHSLIIRENQSIYSAFLELTIKDANNNIQPRSILLRGPAAVVIPNIRINGKSHYIMVQQTRIVDGGKSFEFPSGGLDPNLTSRESACKELFEEASIIASPIDLKTLATELKASESSLDETVDWYYYESNKTEDMDNINVSFGIQPENEYTTKVWLSLNEIKKINSFQVKTALQLLHENNLLDD